jgi:DNA-binding NtrC family response regulator
MSLPRLLIVDDDVLIRDTMAFALAQSFTVRVAADRVSAVSQADSERPDLALIDLGLPPAPATPNEGLSGQSLATHARRARALGAFAFVPKPSAPAIVERALISALAAPTLPVADYELIGESPPMRRLKAQIDLAAASSYPVLITGESGTGKEKVARALHAVSPP